MITRFLRQLLLAGSIALCCASPAAAEKVETVSLNFVDSDIQEVIRAISQISGKNFLVDPRVKGKINIVSATPVSPALAYDILLSALRMQGYASVESSGVTKIIPEADAKLHVDTLASSQNQGDQLVTRVFILKNESASQLVNVVRPMVAPNNLVVAYPASNALVVTDYASGIRRIEKLIASIDKSDNDVPLIIPVLHASAIDLANLINKLMPETATAQSGDANQRFVLTADSRTNALLLRSDNPGRIERVKQLVASLDSAASVPGNIHVVTLKNAEANRLAQTLNAILSGTPTASTPTTPATPATTAAKVTPNSPASSGGIIQADTATNTLIVTAPDPVYNNIRAVIEKLDVRRPQVFVEALIVEVTADKAAEFGIQWQGVNGINKAGTNIIGGTNFGSTSGNIIGAAADITTAGQGLNIGVVRGTTTLLDGTKVLNLGMLARALESDTNANILSAPNLMTLDNEEAKIVVGQNVPFVTGSYTNTGSSSTAANPFQTIERKDVGLTLKIKPQIMQGGTVKLQVYQEVSSVLSSSLTSATGPTTNKRSIESSILVDENQIVVLGGLIQDSVNNVQNKTPILGDIPLLGNLFRYETRQRSKTNLMVFIRPYIMYQAEATQQFSKQRYEQIGNTREGARLNDNWMLPDDDTQAMPSLKVDGKLDSASVIPSTSDTSQP